MSVIVLTFIVPVRGAVCDYLFRAAKNVAAPLVSGMYGNSGWSGWHSCRVFDTSHVSFDRRPPVLNDVFSRCTYATAGKSCIVIIFT